MRNKKLQVNKTMWIERHKHETIVRKYREKIHRISEDYDMKIMIQSRRINILMKTIKQQKDLIDEFMLKSKPIDDDSPTEDDLDSDFDFDLKNHGNADAENNEFHVDEIKSDPVDQNGEQNNSNEIIHGTEHESTHVADISDKGDANEVLFAIDIQPGVKESKENSTDFVCQLCNKLFSSSRVLSKHKRTVHNAIKGFSCNHCDKAFTARDGLRRHLRIHTGERPFVCGGCNKGFNQSGNLRIHEKSCTQFKTINDQS